MLHKIIITIAIALIAGLTLAQDDLGNPNDPAVNERANACFAGGFWEGKCHTTDVDFDGDVDIHDINWMWNCGWYAIRVERGMLKVGEYPPECYTKDSCPPLGVFSVESTGLPLTLSDIALARNIVNFAQLRGLGWNGTIAHLVGLATAYYSHPSTVIRPNDPRPSTALTPNTLYSFVFDIKFDGCYDIALNVNSNVITAVQSHPSTLCSVFPNSCP